MIIVGKDCDDCRYCVYINEESRKNIKVYCTIKEKEYRYGQCIPCELKTKKEINNNEENCKI